MTTHYQTLPGRTLCNDQSRRFKRLTKDQAQVDCTHCKHLLGRPLDLLADKFLKGVIV